MRRAVAALLCLGLLGCHHRPERAQPAPTFAAGVAGMDWSLIEVDGRLAAGGAGGRRPTISFDATSGRASGFAGCNRFTAPYTLSHDTLRFETPVLTRMACVVGLDIERGYVAALLRTRRYRVAHGYLVLYDEEGPALRYTAGNN